MTADDALAYAIEGVDDEIAEAESSTCRDDYEQGYLVALRDTRDNLVTLRTGIGRR